MRKYLAGFSSLAGLIVIFTMMMPSLAQAKLPNGWKVKAYAPSCLVTGVYVPLRLTASCYGKAKLTQRQGSPAPISLRVCIEESYNQDTPNGPVPSMSWSKHNCLQYGSIASGVWSSAIDPAYSGVFNASTEIWYRSWYSARVASAGIWYKKTGYGTAVMVPAQGPLI